MSSGLLAFIGGMGKGYLAQNERNMDRARQDRQDDRLDRQEERQMRLDAQAKELHDYQIEGINRERSNRKADIEAAKPVAADTAWEQSTDGMTPEQQEELAVKMSTGEVEGTKTYSVAGKNYGADKTASDTALAKANTPEAAQARRMQTLRATGRGTEADQLETTLRQGKLAELQLSDAQLANLDKQHNRALQEQIEKSGGDVFAAAVSIGTETGLGTLAGAKVSVQLNQDGSRQFVTTAADGSKKLGKIYPKGPEGELRLMQELTRADPVTKLQWAHEREQARIAAEERAQGQDRWEKTFKQTAKHQDAQLGIAGGHLALQKSEEARKKFVFSQENKLPAAVKTAYAALEANAKSIDSALAKAQAEGNFRMDDPGAKQLLADRTAISMKMDALLNPYIPAPPGKGGAPAADPFGVFAAPAAAAPAPVAAPAPKPKMTAADVAKVVRGMPTKAPQ